ncbi:hypothetical protein GF325_09520, partial [Candidatus Bathyarchaeota archaeon]|nr:hypothetical protein [Candidatus Bathyarchaeota archaeon]
MSGSTKARTNSQIAISAPTAPPSQDFKSFLYFYILFAAEVGFAVFLGGLMPDFQLSYNIAETGEPVSFSFNLRELIEVILLGPVFCATAWKANNILVNNLDQEVRKQVRLNFWRALYIAYCAVVVIGAT